jgi:hypothetical protein
MADTSWFNGLLSGASSYFDPQDVQQRDPSRPFDVPSSSPYDAETAKTARMALLASAGSNLLAAGQRNISPNVRAQLLANMGQAPANYNEVLKSGIQARLAAAQTNLANYNAQKMGIVNKIASSYLDDAQGQPQGYGVPQQRVPQQAPQGQTPSFAPKPAVDMNNLPPDIQSTVAHVSNITNTPPEIVAGLWNNESGFSRNAPRGDGGLSAGPMQVQPAALAQVNSAYGTNHSQQDLESGNGVLGLYTGARYWNLLNQQFKNPMLATMAYNWGPDNVQKWVASGANPNAIPPAVKAYVASVHGNGAAPQNGATGQDTAGAAPSPTGNQFAGPGTPTAPVAGGGGSIATPSNAAPTVPQARQVSGQAPVAGGGGSVAQPAGQISDAQYQAMQRRYQAAKVMGMEIPDMAFTMTPAQAQAAGYNPNIPHTRTLSGVVTSFANDGMNRPANQQDIGSYNLPPDAGSWSMGPNNLPSLIPNSGVNKPVDPQQAAPLGLNPNAGKWMKTPDGNYALVPNSGRTVPIGNGYQQAPSGEQSLIPPTPYENSQIAIAQKNIEDGVSSVHTIQTDLLPAVRTQIALQNAGMSQGAIPALTQELRSVAVSAGLLGPDQAKTLSDQEAFSAASNHLVTAMKGTGVRLTNADLPFFKAAQAQLSNTATAGKFLSAFLYNKLQAEISYEDAKQAYFRNDPKNGISGFDKWYQDNGPEFYAHPKTLADFLSLPPGKIAILPPTAKKDAILEKNGLPAYPNYPFYIAPMGDQ